MSDVVYVFSGTFDRVVISLSVFGSTRVCEWQL